MMKLFPLLFGLMLVGCAFACLVAPWFKGHEACRPDPKRSPAAARIGPQIPESVRRPDGRPARR